MADLKGKAVLIVNTATKCGPAHQFRNLEALHKTYKNRGLIVLAFPSNQIQNQEPETNDSMKQGWQLIFGVTFQKICPDHQA